jgi:non-specific serine/threonine protein kinase
MGPDPDAGLRLAVKFGTAFWSPRGLYREGRESLHRLLSRPGRRTNARAGAFQLAGYLAMRQNDYPAAEVNFEQALELWRELGDRQGLAGTLCRYGVVPHHLGDYDRAEAMLGEALRLARELGDSFEAGTALRNLADLARDRGDHAGAVAAYDECLDLARERGDDHEVAYAVRGLGHVARARGEYDRAERFLCESLELLRPLRDRRCVPLCLEGLACITVGPNWAERAARLLGAARAVQASTGAPAPPSDMADYRRTEADARANLGAARFAVAWAAGAAMSLDEAIAYAPAPAATSDPARMSATIAYPTVPDEAVGASSPVSDHAHRQDVGPLSPREREVVALIARGLSNREIATELVLSVRTVERHIENVYNRLGISGKAGRAVVTAYALRHGVIEVPN